ncbi:uncharacterized protein LOC131665678 [Phymastichus coffea]|uniref:uncharacterized protein LOC131665678 n=1 Tax=Phymastichus coffea TaxID=108790 RepID=UPI00273C7039|nr:uncharacterized protein LOC131665678 [Phymastichus coffea]
MRLILFALLATAAGLPITSANQQSNVLGLKRFVDRVRIGDVIEGCTGVSCVNRSITNIRDQAISKSLDGVQNGADEEDVNEDKNETAIEEGRGKKGKKKKGYGKMMMALAGFTKAVILYFMIHAVAALAGKALIVAKIALAIAVAVALKKSSEHKTSYEIVKHPQYSSVHTHSSSVDYDHGSGGYEGSSRRRRELIR